MGFVSMRKNFGRHMRIGLYIIFAIFLVGCFYFYGAYTSNPARQSERGAQSGPVATVNGQDIDRASFDTLFTAQYEQYERMGMGSLGMLEMLRWQILNSMIQQKLLVMAAEQQGIRVSNRDVEKEIQRQIDEILKARGLTADRNSEDRKFIEKAMRRRADEVRDQMMIQRLADTMKSQVKVTDEALRDSYKQVKARHILIKVNSGADKAADSAAQQKAEQVLKRLQGGADFATVAKEVSQDKATAPKGGDLGWFGSGQMTPEFERAAFGLKPGQMSGLVKTPFGYHIIQVEEVRYTLPKDFDQKKAEYRKQYIEQQAGRAWQEFNRQLQSQAKIEIRDPEMRAAKAQMEGRSDEAIAEYTKALESSGQLGDQAHAAVLYDLGQLYGQKKDWKKATELYERAIDVAPSSLQDVYLALADAYLKLGNKAKALEYYKNAEDEAPDDYGVRQQLLTAYKSLGESESAARQQKWIDDEQRKMAEEQKKRAEIARKSAEEAQQKAGASAPTGAGAPAETKTGTAQRPKGQTSEPAKTESAPAGGR